MNKNIRSLTIALMLVFAGIGHTFAQAAPEGTFVFTGQASTAQPFVITAVISDVAGVSTINYSETLNGAAFCSSTLTLTTVVSATHFIYTAAEITADCTRGEAFHVYTLDPTFNQIVLKKADVKTFTLLKQ